MYKWGWYNLKYVNVGKRIFVIIIINRLNFSDFYNSRLKMYGIIQDTGVENSFGYQTRFSKG